MDIKRFGLTCLGVFLTLVILSLIQNYAAMHLGYVQGMQIRAIDVLQMVFVSILFCFLFAKMRSQSVGNGIVYAIAIFLFLAIETQVINNFDPSSAISYFWNIGALIQLVVMGIVASLIQGCKSCS